MPKAVYTVGDTIRMQVSFVTTANIEDVHAFYVREDRYAGVGGYDISRSPLSLEGSVEETTIEQLNPYALPLKRHTATLITLVDRDHVPGTYNLDHLELRTAGGLNISLGPDPGDPVDSFRISEESHSVRKVEVRVIKESDEG